MTPFFLKRTFGATRCSIWGLALVSTFVLHWAPLLSIIRVGIIMMSTIRVGTAKVATVRMGSVRVNTIGWAPLE